MLFQTLGHSISLNKYPTKKKWRHNIRQPLPGETKYLPAIRKRVQVPDTRDISPPQPATATIHSQYFRRAIHYRHQLPLTDWLTTDQLCCFTASYTTEFHHHKSHRAENDLFSFSSSLRSANHYPSSSPQTNCLLGSLIYANPLHTMPFNLLDLLRVSECGSEAAYLISLLTTF